MWRTLVLVILVLGFASPGSAQGNGTDPGGDGGTDGGGGGGGGGMPMGGNGTGGGNTTACMNARPLMMYESRAPNLAWMNMRRAELKHLKPSATTSACGLEPLKMSDTLMQAAQDFAMMCPLTMGAPMMPMWSSMGGHGTIVVYMQALLLQNGSTGNNFDSNWLSIINEMPEDQFKQITGSYLSGAWDPIFQILWSETMEVGIYATQYTNGDLAALTRMFNRPVTEPMDMISWVAMFNPPGCMAGSMPWKTCGFDPTGGTTDHPTGGPDPGPNPGPDPGPNPTDQPHGGATRVSGNIVINFATMSISSIIIGNLLRSPHVVV